MLFIILSNEHSNHLEQNKSNILFVVTQLTISRKVQLGQWEYQ